MDSKGTLADWQPHPWVTEGDGRLRVGIGVSTAAGPPDWPAVHRLVTALDEIAVDSFWQPDHPAFTHDCWLMLAAIATHTRRLRLGPIVSCAGYRPPALLARQATDLDRLSGGRAVLGLGAGWVEIEYPLMGLPFPSLRDRYQVLRETVEVVDGLWTSRPVMSRAPVDGAIEVESGLWVKQPFTYTGQFTQFDRAYQFPSPVQQPRVPVLIGGSGERVTLRLVARYADMANLDDKATRTPEEVASRLAALRRHCADLGRPYDTVLVSYFLNGVLLAPTAERLAEKVEVLPAWYQGATRNSLTTPAMIETLRPILAAGIRYLVFNLTMWDDIETARLLVEEVAPALEE